MRTIARESNGVAVERFSEFLSEARQGRSFRVFTVCSNALAWLASD
jgi:hypothetical protein